MDKTNTRHRRHLFWQDFRWLLFWLILGIFVGHHFQQISWGIVIALLIYNLWQQLSMQRFYAWIDKKINIPPPEMMGGFSFIANTLYQSRRIQQQSQQEKLAFIKKIRGSLLAMQDAVILLDEKDCLTWWNQSAETFLELTEQYQGKNILDIITVPEFHDYYQSTASPNDGIRLSSWVYPERFWQCEVTRFGHDKLLIIYDVTRLQHLEQMRKDFIGNASHELRTPLTVLMGYIETFASQPDLDKRWQRGFQLMIQQASRMNSIINDLLLLSRLENDEIPTFHCINMPEILTEIFDDAQIYNREYGHLIELELNSQTHIMGVETYLNSALSNLVINAIKYTPKGGEITISWSQVKEGMLFSVKDNGIGIAAEHLERLTERFYRVDSGRSRATGGTGLGLAIVKHVLYQHHAKLTIESREGIGSTFSVLFPKNCLCEPSSSKDKEDESGYTSTPQDTR